MTIDFDYLDPTLIVVDRPNRQRRELTGIEELAESIRNVGLIQPIVIDRDLTLIAGERRLTACLSIGLSPIPCRYLDNLSVFERHLIELEENVKRVDLPWTDHVAAITEYHRLMLERTPEWTLDDTAQRLGMTKSSIGNYITVAEQMENPMVKEADKFSTALNAARRIKERKQASAKQDLAKSIDTLFSANPAVPTAPKAEPEPPRAEVIQADFCEWVKTYSGPKFNLIHCDFPYGINTGDKSGQSAAKITGSYDDGPEVYRKLLSYFINHTDRFVDESAHLIFWFSMNFFEETKLALSTRWRVDPFPLIWHKSDNAGIIPDANRGPRRTYETAFFASRGDRKIVRPVANSFSGATTRDFHTSEKPRPMLEHFLRMVTDETTRMLDPTAGSGNAVRVAWSLGADAALGLELNPDFAATAQSNVLAGAVALAQGSSGMATDGNG